jgi:BlaI family transcriptional regulator, penicillinase repressor
LDPRRKLSRRERQVLDAVYRLGEASVAEVLAEITDPPGYDSVRTVMRLLTEKGVLRYRQDGQRYLYSAVVEKGKARQGALEELVRTFFGGSARAAALALLELQGDDASEAEIERLRLLLAEEGEGAAQTEEEG